MRKCLELATVLMTEYNEKLQAKRAPQLLLSLKDKKNESYRAKYAAGKLSIEADSPLAQAYGICQLATAVQAKHLADYLGENKPRFALRPIWLKASIGIELTPNVNLYLPEFLLAEDAELLIPRFCKRLIECGYNAILIGTHQCGWEMEKTMQGTVSTPNLQALFQQIHDHGIKIVLKPTFSFDLSHFYSDISFTRSLESSFDNLFSVIPEFESLFWESFCQTTTQRNFSQDHDLTEAEMTLKEIRLIEKALKRRSNLIYYISTGNGNEGERQARWMAPLIDDVGKGTTIAFNTVFGAAYDDHQIDHPLWEILRESPDVSAKGWLPILNGGLVKQGEGLWPITNFDLIDRFVTRCYRHHFAGLITLAAHFPEAGSILDCNLWVTGHSLWHLLPASLLAETWFKAFRPNENRTFCLKAMKLAREIALELSRLRDQSMKLDSPLTNEEAKIYGENLLASLKQLKWMWQKQKMSGSKNPSIKEYFDFFAHDVRQLLGAFLPTFNLPFVHILDGEGSATSFWNHELETPNRGHKNSIMETIFLENRQW